MDAIIAIGSNMGDRQDHIDRALRLMEERVGRILAVSDVIETKAYGNEEQDDFLNLAVRIDTALTPHELIECLHEIEAQLGRVRRERWGPRTIDLDIVFYGDTIVDEEGLRIPHVDLYNREFVLGPVSQISPEQVDPRTGKTAEELLAELVSGRR